MRFFEEYGCGCASPLMARKRLPGYCPAHGEDREFLYDQNGSPCGEATIKRAMELHEALAAALQAGKRGAK